MTQIKKPKFKGYFHVEIVEGEGVFLLSEKDCFLLDGRFYRLLAPLIDGDRTVDQIADSLEGKLSAAEVYYALTLLEQKGYIVENDDSIPAAIADFCETLNLAPKIAFSRLQATKVAVNALGDISVKDAFIAQLESLHVQVSENADITVVLTDDYLQKDLAVFNQKAFASKHPWTIVKPVGTKIWIGPVFYPGKTGCWECLANRLRVNRPIESFIQKRQGISTPLPTSRSRFPARMQTALSLAATETVKWIIQGENKQLEGIVMTFDTISLEMQSHPLIQRPQCPVCGDGAKVAATNFVPLGLKSRKKTFTADGGHRCCSPEETLKKYERHISPITGIVGTLTRIPDRENNLIHTYSAGHNLALPFENFSFLRKSLRSQSGGKGKTDLQSKVSGLCEAIERYSGVFQGDEIRQKGTYTAMADAAIHPNDCLNFSEAQYQNRADWNAKCAINFRVPEPFDENLEIDWTPVWSFTHQKFKYLPTAYCYYGYPFLQKPFCWADSNGNAAGNTLEEAILQGFMELVERDSVALWWYNRVTRPAVNLESFDEPYFQALKEYYRTIDRELWVLDITSDLNVPAFVAISRRKSGQREDIILGFGAHFDAKIGILRAVTEMNQFLSRVLSEDADDSTRYRGSDDRAIDWWKTATLENQPYLVANVNTAAKVASDYPQLESDDILQDAIDCAAIAQKKGMEMLVLDQTRPDIGLNVVKVIVPGMRHFWPRLGPGRLYDVPVQLNWVPKPLSENQLNPLPIVF